MAAEQHDAFGHEHLARLRERTQPGGEVERAAAEPIADRHRLARIDPDPDPQRETWLGPDLVCEALLHPDRAADRRPRRIKDAQRLVTAQLDHVTAAALDLLMHHLREAPRE